MKKIIILTFLFLFAFVLMHAEDAELAKYYIIQAVNFINTGSPGAADEYLDRSREYSVIFPEYYYYKNMILSDTKENIAYKKNNSDLIIKYMRNAFTADQYDMLKQTAFIYEKTRNFTKAYNSYDQMLSTLKKTDKDYLNCIKMLFNAPEPSLSGLIPQLINRAKAYFDSVELDYYLLRYKILAGTAEISEVRQITDKLKANNFSPSKTLYIQVLFYRDAKIVTALFNEYEKLKTAGMDTGFKKRISFELLKKAAYLNDSQLKILLNDWNQTGQSDQKTMIILQNARLLSVLKSAKELNAAFLNYTGARISDRDEDGEWEDFYEYSNGIMIHSVTDSNQDGIAETEAFYNEKAVMKEHLIYYSLKDYVKMSFNVYDNSLISLEYYTDAKLIERITMLQSSYKPDKKTLHQINKKSVIPYTAYIEDWKDGYKKLNYTDASKEYVFADNNKNGIYEEKIMFKNNLIDSVYKDKNENGIFEVFEKFENSKLSYLKYMTDENYGDYNYTERYLPDKTVKQWDTNHDGIFETETEEYADGIMIKKTDINFDKIFDFAYYYKNGQLYRILSLSDNKEVKFSEKNVKEDYNDYKKNKKWNIISSREISSLILPDDIIINDKNNLSGIYYYKNQKFYFDKGIIKSGIFDLKLYFINNDLYLYDNY